METKLERITQLSRDNPDMVFTSIGHLINSKLLKLILPTPKLLFAYGEQRELKQKIVKLLQIDHWQRITIAVNNQAVQILRNRQQHVFVLL